MLGLGITLLTAAAYIGFGDASGELENGLTGIVLKKLRGPIPALLWVTTAFFCLRQFLKDKERVKELEDRQSRDRIIKRYSDARMSTEDVIRLLEKGAGPPRPPQEKQPPAGIIIRVKQKEQEIKSVKQAMRKKLPAPSKPEDPHER